MALAESSSQLVRVLLLDATPGRTVRALEQLQHGMRVTFEIQRVDTLDLGILNLTRASYDVLVVDVSEAIDEAVLAIRSVRGICPELPIFVIADSEDPSLAIELLREGAEDCLVKKFINPRAIERALLYGIERKQGQCALQKRDLRYRVLFSQIALGIAVFEVACDEQGLPLHRFLEVNTAFEKYAGQESGHVLGRTLDEVFPDGAGFWTRACESAPASGDSTSFETYEAPSKQWLEVTAFRLGTSQVAVTFADISERKRAQEVLRESEEKFRELAENVREVFFIAESDPPRITYLSPAYEEIWGRPRQEAYDRPDAWTNSVHAEDRENAASIFLRSQAGEHTTAEYRVVRPDGSIRFIRSRAFPVNNADGKSYRLVGIAEDITERKKTEAEMNLRNQLASLSAAVGVALANAATLSEGLKDCAEALVEGIDAAFARIWTLNQPDKVLDLQASAGIYTDLDGGHARIPVGKFEIGRIAESGEPHLTNSVLGDPLVGDQAWARREGMVAFAGYPLKVEGRTVGVVAAFARHTLDEAAIKAFASVADLIAQFIRRKRAEAETERLAAALEQTAEMVVITDAAGTIQFVNPAFTAATGYSPGEAVGQNPRVLKSGREDRAYYTNLWQTIKRGEVWRGQLTNRRKDGTTYPEEMTITPIRDAHGAITNFIAIKEDVTERRVAEEALRESERRHRLLFERNMAGVFRNTLEGRILDCNQAAAELFGYDSPADIMSVPIGDLYASASERQQAMEELMQKKILTNHELKLRRKNGEPAWVIANLNLADGQIVEGTIVDITKRKQAEEELRFKTALLEAQSESTMDGILVVDDSGSVVLANQQFARMFAIPGEMLDSRADRLLLEYVVGQVENAAAFSERVKYLYCHRHEKSTDEVRLKDGRIFDRYSAPLIDAHGGYCGRIWYFRDITERKRAEETLQRSEERARLLFAAIPHPAYVFDRETLEFVEVNETALQCYGYGRDDFLRMTITEICLPEDVKQLLETVHELESRPEATGQWKHCTRDGRVLDVEVSFQAIRFGTCSAALTVAQNITERKEAERRRSAQYATTQALTTATSLADARSSVLQAVCESVNWDIAAFWEVNQPNQTLHRVSNWHSSRIDDTEFAEVEKSTRRITFAPGEGLLGRAWESAKPAWIPNILDDANCPMTQFATNAGLHGVFAFPVPTSKGIAGVMEFYSRDIHGPDEDLLRLLGAVGSQIGQFEERTRLEVDLRQAQKLEAVGQLAAGIAHEINTPIQFVGDNTRFLRDSFRDVEKLIASYEKLNEAASGKLDPLLLQNVAEAKELSDWDFLKGEVPKALDQTLDGVERVAKIVRAMKEFSHVDRSGQKAAADLNRALESTLVVARNELRYVAEVVTEFGEIPPVLCYLGDLNQVFLNLFVNAAHAIGDVVRETNTMGVIRVKTWQEDKHVVVAVSDTGAGIPEEIRQRIFEPFFTTKEVGKGTGQGLTLARSVVVDRHGGSLTFESELGKGTTFFVRLPVDSVPPIDAGGPRA